MEGQGVECRKGCGRCCGAGVGGCFGVVRVFGVVNVCGVRCVMLRNIVLLFPMIYNINITTLVPILPSNGIVPSVYFTSAPPPSPLTREGHSTRTHS